jgi:hypothetical protein
MPTLVVYHTAPPDQALASLRYRLPAEALGWQIIHGKEGVDSIYPERVQAADVVLIARDFPRFFPGVQAVLAEARRLGKRVLYDLDDLLLALPPEHPNHTDYHDALGGMLYTITAVDALIVSTPPLRQLLLPLQPNIHLWPTLLPDSLWQIRPPQLPTNDSPLVVGYMGGTSHAPDVAWLAPVWQQLLAQWGERLQLHFWGCAPPDALANHPQVRHHLSAGIGDYVAFAESFSTTAVADVWLAPLVPNLFNQCKSSIKFWEYSAVGGAGVYSGAEPYTAVVQHGVNGLLASTHAEWENSINRLLSDPQLRYRMAQNAQETLRTQGMITPHLPLWQEIYTTVYTQPAPANPAPAFAQMMQRLGEAVQQRADERDREAHQLIAAITRIQQLEQALHGAHQRNQVLQERSDQLEAIISNPRWRTWQQLKRIASLDFSPLPPHEPFT